jgi:hypothetical protein
MKKIILTIVSAIMLTTYISPAKANDQKVVAIIDTAVDVSKFDNIIYEVCFTLNTCPNGGNFMEGPGSANVSNFSVNGMSHGSNLVSVSRYTDPNVKIVFIRISDLNVYPKFSAIHTSGSSLERALDWVSKNAIKYSIDAVSISQARTNFPAGTCPASPSAENSVKKLLDIKVPTFAGSGNDGFKNKIAWPACVPGIYPVGALGPNGTIASYSNTTSQVKVLANGCPAYSGNHCVKILDYMGVMRVMSGTSIATPTAAVKFASSNMQVDQWLQSLSKLETYAVVK